MTNAELAARLQALDWSATSLQHQLAISAAVLALGDVSRRATFVMPSTLDKDDARRFLPVRLPDNVIDLREVFRREIETSC